MMSTAARPRRAVRGQRHRGERNDRPASRPCARQASARQTRARRGMTMAKAAVLTASAIATSPPNSARRAAPGTASADTSSATATSSQPRRRPRWRRRTPAHAHAYRGGATMSRRSPVANSSVPDELREQPQRNQRQPISISTRERTQRAALERPFLEAAAAPGEAGERAQCGPAKLAQHVEIVATRAQIACAPSRTSDQREPLSVANASAAPPARAEQRSDAEKAVST